MTSLTDFILAMHRADPRAIAEARRNPQPLAAKYGVSTERASGYLRLHIVQGDTKWK